LVDMFCGPDLVYPFERSKVGVQCLVTAIVAKALLDLCDSSVYAMRY
jgi:hypothetical protein